MNNFVEILRELIEETNLSLRQLAKQSAVSVMQYSRYLGGSIPTIDVTLKIAKYFDCSLDYLFGLTESRKTASYATYSYDMSVFLDRYKKLLADNHTTHFKFIKTVGFDESIIRHWRAGSKPRLDIVYAIAKNLNGSMDELIGRY